MSSELTEAELADVRDTIGHTKPEAMRAMREWHRLRLLDAQNKLRAYQGNAAAMERRILVREEILRQLDERIAEQGEP